MPTYDKNGQLVYNAYKKDGTIAQYGFDRNGNLIFPNIDPTDFNFKVMTFNVQSWSGINEWDYINSIFEDYDVDIIGSQESKSNSELTALGYTYKATGSEPNTNIVFSKHELSDITSKSYDANHYEGKRGYQKMYFTFNGKRIALFNTHLETHTGTTYQYPQAQELFDAVSEEEYFIITGDLNTVCESVNDAQYINVVKPFVDAGYNVANCCKRFGFNDTWTSGTYASTSWYQPDNIITSANITMANMVVDMTKVELQTELAIDHLPVIAYLKIV